MRCSDELARSLLLTSLRIGGWSRAQAMVRKSGVDASVRIENADDRTLKGLRVIVRLFTRTGLVRIRGRYDLCGFAFHDVSPFIRYLFNCQTSVIENSRLVFIAKHGMCQLRE